MSKRVLVTGAMGMLGRTLLPILQDKKYCCVGIARNAGKVGKIPVQKCDISNYNAVKKVIAKFKPDFVIHLASITGNMECEENPELTFLVNVQGTFNILNAIKDSECKIIFSSSREVYGMTSKLVHEESKLNPINLNGITKEISEKLILNYNRVYKIPYVILRFSNFYSLQNTSRGISKMIKNAVEGKPIIIYGGNQTIDLLNINDATNAIIKSANYTKSGIFNIGSGKTITPNILIKKLEKISQKKIKRIKKPYRPFEVKKFHFDISSAVKNLKFKSKLSFEDDLSEFVKRYSFTK